MKAKTVELIIETPLSNEDLISVFNRGAENLKEFGIDVREINIVGSANSYMRGVSYNSPQEMIPLPVER